MVEVAVPILRIAPLGGESEQAFFAFFKPGCRKHTQLEIPTEANVNQLARPEQKIVKAHGATTEEIARGLPGISRRNR
jgi:hypothetical protein